MLRIPSLHSLQQIPRIGPEDAYLIRAWLMWAHNGGPAPDIGNHKTANAQAWANSCHHRPRAVALAQACVACIITEGHTTSWDVFQDQAEWTSLAGPAWEAVDVGDPYIPTLIYRRGRGYMVKAWGDLPEVNR